MFAQPIASAKLRQDRAMWLTRAISTWSRVLLKGLSNAALAASLVLANVVLIGVGAIPAMLLWTVAISVALARRREVARAPRREVARDRTDGASAEGSLNRSRHNRSDRLGRPVVPGTSRCSSPLKHADLVSLVMPWRAVECCPRDELVVHRLVAVANDDRGSSQLPLATTRSMIRATVGLMPRSLHVRLDDASVAALEVVRGGELTDSEAVRTALREAAARRRVRSALREEARRLAADEGDREEMRIVREQLADLAPGVSD